MQNLRWEKLLTVTLTSRQFGNKQMGSLHSRLDYCRKTWLVGDKQNCPSGLLSCHLCIQFNIEPPPNSVFYCSRWYIEEYEVRNKCVRLWGVDLILHYANYTSKWVNNQIPITKICFGINSAKDTYYLKTFVSHTQSRTYDQHTLAPHRVLRRCLLSMKTKMEVYTRI